MGLRAGLDKCGKSGPPTGIRSPDRPARRHSLYRTRYPADNENLGKLSTSGKPTVVPLHAIKAYKGGRGIAPLILNLGT